MARLLVIRPGGVGDCILSFPAIENLRARCAYLEIWVPRAIVPLVRFADRVRAISATGLDLFGLDGVDADSGLVETLRSFDSIVSWYGSNREDFRAAMSALSLPIEFHRALPPAVSDSALHACDFFCAQVGAPSGAIPRIPLDSQLSTAAGAQYVAIHPFSGSPRKNWPLDRFDEVARILDRPVEWCATPEQSAAINGRSPLLAVDDLSQVARWLADASVYIGNDSGITHLAAAVGTPVVALFGDSDARVWGPRGRHVQILEGAGMKAVEVESVIAATAGALTR
jgi:heptosyltransferase-3